ncbi:MAG: hypothetical protein ACYC46_09855 [Acidobacteriaceae bacterium]
MAAYFMHTSIKSSKLLNSIFIGVLVLSVFLWGTQYKDSLYHVHAHNLSSSPIPKLLAEEQRTVKAKSATLDHDSMSPVVEFVASISPRIAMSERHAILRYQTHLRERAEESIFQPQLFLSILFFRPPPFPVSFQ